jgi:tetraacyldisaccharide-1-P 4'-kinase
VRGAREFPDHHAFSRSEWQGVVGQARSAGARVLVTAKDAVRLTGDARREVLVLEMVWEWMEGDMDPERLVDQVLTAAEER